MAVNNQVGQIIKGYELQELLASGGFGSVYRAKQTTIEREVAIKVILPDLASQPEFIRRFDSEAQLVARLEHPHIVPLYDYWRNPDGAYLVMRYFRGGSLRTLLNQGALDPTTCTHILDQLASALDLAHRNDVIHRDIKPANILLDEDGNAYLGDFGIAKDIGAFGSEITDTNDMVGSLDYITPEQAQGQDVTPQTDVYSLGILLYEMLAGEHPYAGIMSVQRVYKHMTEPVPDIQTLPEEISFEVNEVIQKATAKNPADRYETVLDLALAMRSAVGLSDPSHAPSIAAMLTSRERDILAYLVQGVDGDQMAENLSVTIATVRWQIQQIYQKLGVSSRQEAIDRVHELELVDEEGRLLISDIQSRSAIITLPEPLNPYKGLHAFQSTDVKDFFGREDQIQHIIERMDEDHEWERFIAIIGPSGSGKSSLVRAGVLPALRHGAIENSDSWFFVDMVPGITPVEQLLVALVHIAADSLAEVHAMLKGDVDGIVKAANHILPDDGSELVLVVDQFEELFTLVEDEETRMHFMAMLRHTIEAPDSRVRIILTMRADYYDRPLQYSIFGELLRIRMETVLPLSADGLERAIVGPAERVGVSFEMGLVSRIVSDVNTQVGALPLLQYSLTELFDRRSGWFMTIEAYESIGGAVGALANRADELYQQLTEEEQALAKQLFIRLVTLGEGAEDVRRRIFLEEVYSLVDTEDLMQELINLYSKYRLILLDRDADTRKPTIEVAHEAILRQWERLRGWLNESRDDIRQERNLTQLAQEWRRSEYDKSYLLSGSRLEIFDSWSQTTQLTLTPIEQDYLEASVKQRDKIMAAERERQEREDKLEERARRILTILALVFAVSTVIAFALSVIAFDARDEAESNFTRAERIRLAAQAQIALNNDEDVILPALLALRSMSIAYSPEADSALLGALGRGFSEQQYIGHSGAVISVDFSPDDTRMVTASNDHTAIVWDVATGEELLTLEGHESQVVNAVYAPDGTRIVTASADQTVRVWDATTGNELYQLPQHESEVLALAWSPDGTTILTSDESGNAYLWEADTGEQLHILNEHQDTVSWGSFSSDSLYVVTGGFDNRAIIWHVASGEAIQTFEGHSACVCGGAFSEDGELLVTASYDRTARIWDVATGEELERLVGHTNLVHDARFSRNGEFVISSSQDNTARLWDVATGQQVREFTGHTSGVNGVDFDSDGRFILTAGNDNTARLWDTDANTEPRVFTPPPTSIGTTSVLYIEQFPDGRIVATGSSDGSFRFWSIRRGIILGDVVETGVSGAVNDIALSPNIIATAGNVLALWDEDTGEAIQTLPGHDGAVFSVTFSSDNNQLLSGGADGTVRLWDVLAREEIQMFEGHTGTVRSVIFSPDETQILSGSDDGTMRLWDVESGMLIKVFAHGDVVRDVAMSPDGLLVASGGDDNTAQVWEVDSEILIRIYEGHADSIWSIAFAPNGETLLTGSADQTARVWDVVTGEVIRQLAGHDDIVRTVGFASNGRRILTGDNVSTYLWMASLDDAITLACDRLPRDFTDEEREFFNIEASDTCASFEE